MSRPLYEPCTLCEGTDTPRADAQVVVEPADRARVAEQLHGGVCPGCQGRRYLPIGLTAGQAERLARTNEDLVCQGAALRSLVRRALDDRIGADWVREACSMLGLPARPGAGGPLFPMLDLLQERDTLEAAAAVLWLAATSDRWTAEGLRSVVADAVRLAPPPAETIAAVRAAVGLDETGQGPGGAT